MTNVASFPEPEAPPPDPERTRKVFIAVVVTVLVVLGLKVVLTRWWRKGGPRRAIVELAEDGAVKLADTLLDEVLPAA
jgi:hypothetical protein